MNIKEISIALSKNLSKYRLRHSVFVMHTAHDLAKMYKICPKKAKFTGLLHDCGKYFSNADMIKKAKELNIAITNLQYLEPDLLHGPVGAIMAKARYTEIDEDMYNAIYYHTTGRVGMSDLEKIIYVADLIEPTRRFPEVEEMRSYVGIDLDLLTIKVMDIVLTALIRNGKYIDPVTISARNALYNNYYVNK